MIVDQLDSSLLYGGLGSRVAIGLALLNEESVRAAAPGRYEVDGENLFYVVDEYETAPIEDGRLEVHRTYMDIQYIVSGTECIGVSSLEGLEVIEPYDGAKDFALYKAGALMSRCVLQAGDFAILWPNEAHMPGRVAGERQQVKKIVVKVRME
ncbi:MAG: NanQ anomerase/TabA/YiaL family protein [Planctomycetota bacterium]|jgi:YhcH/YjgK/YiaL family protein